MARLYKRDWHGRFAGSGGGKGKGKSGPGRKKTKGKKTKRTVSPKKIINNSGERKRKNMKRSITAANKHGLSNTKEARKARKHAYKSAVKFNRSIVGQRESKARMKAEREKFLKSTIVDNKTGRVMSGKQLERRVVGRAIGGAAASGALRAVLRSL